MPSQNEHLLVSVMPSAFRGREGLARKTFAPSQIMPMPVSALMPVPKPTVVTVQQAVQAKLTPPPPKKRHRVPVWLIIAGVILMGGIAIGGWFLLASLNAPETPVAVPPVVPPLPPVASTPPVAPPPVALPPPTTPANPFGNGVYPGKDSDSDGLTDVEEALYRSHPLPPDTDCDAHIDGNEVHHLYDPNGKDPQRLADTRLVERIAPTGFGYSMLVVTSFERTIRADSRQLLVRVPTGEMFQIVLQPIEPTMTIMDWYRAQIPVSEQVALDSTRTKQGFVSAWTSDQLTAYVRLSDDQLAIVTYQLGPHDRVEYRQTMEMMINSLERVP